MRSENIRIFPSSNRAQMEGIDYGTNFTTEYNLSNIVNQLLNKEGFVISEQFEANSPFKFNIAGYCFEVSKGSYITDTSASDPGTTGYYQNYVKFTVTADTVEASIWLESSDSLSFKKLAGTDKNTSTFSDNSGEKKSLIILKKIGGSWVIPDGVRAFCTDDGELI